MSQGRRCAWRPCPNRLPRSASKRQRYCSPACVARAYRARRRGGPQYRLWVAQVRSWRGTATAEDLALLTAQRRCAHCGRLLLSQRADARYCNRSCKAKAYRARRATRTNTNDHDV